MSMSFARLLISAVLLTLCAMPGPAQAGELEDCNGPAAAKIEPACAAIINDQSHTDDERLRAYLGRSRLFMSRANLDAALADADAAVQLNPKSVPALLSRGFARERKGNLGGALADINQAIELDPKVRMHLPCAAG